MPESADILHMSYAQSFRCAEFANSGYSIMIGPLSFCCSRNVTPHVYYTTLGHSPGGRDERDAMMCRADAIHVHQYVVYAICRIDHVQTSVKFL